MENLKLIIGGDFAPRKSNENLIKTGNFIEKLDKKFKEYWNNADYRILNLECVLCEEEDKKIKKSGSYVGCSQENINGIKSLNPDLICLGNNHILDYGKYGLEKTMELLEKNNLKYTGIIKNNSDNLSKIIFKKDNLKIGIYNVCENEFSAATYSNMGTNGLNEVKNCKEIMELSKTTDYVVVIFHGGKEHYRYVTPNCQRICRNFIDFGANIVITQHTHCVGCKEEYNNGTIIYGQGDFLFDSPLEEDRNTGLLIEIDFTKNSYIIDYIPIDKEGSLFKISSNNDIINGFLSRSEEIKNEETILEKYNELCDEKINGYLKAISGNKLIYKLMDKIYNKYFLNYYYNEKNLLKILNFIDCESHRELLRQGIINRISKKI